jgi:CheY-like chemotaxis protein
MMIPQAEIDARDLELRTARLVHDLNNTLSTVVGFSELVIDKPHLLDDRATTLRYMDSIRLAGREATRIVLQLQQLWWPAATPEFDTNRSVAFVDSGEVAGPSLAILMIDDDEGVRSAIAECLIADGHRVAVAASGEAGLATLRDNVFDLVITDRAMPDMSGDLVAAEVKRLAPATAVIMLTGFGELIKSATEHPADVDLVVSKPLTLSDLRRAIATFMP